MRYLISVLVLCTLTLVSCKFEALSGKPTVNIGVTLPLTGDQAANGTLVKKALQLSLRDAKRDHELKYNYNVIFADDALDSKKTLLNYNRFRDVDKVKAVLSMWGNALVISKHTDEDKIIHLGCSWGYALGQGLYNLNDANLPDEQVGALISELVKREIKKIGLIYTATVSDQEIISILLPELKKNNIEVSFAHMFQATQKDFKTDILTMKKDDAEVVFVSLLSPAMEIYMKQAHDLDFKPNYTSLDYPNYNPQLFEGHWYISSTFGTPDFMEYFAKETREQPGSCVANLYDGLQILIRAFEETPAEEDETPDTTDVVNTILSYKEIKGGAVGNTYIDDEGNIHTPSIVKIIKDGKPVVLD